MKETVFLKKPYNKSLSANVLKKAKSIKGITNISLDTKNCRLTFDYATHNAYEGLRALLDSLGYTFSEAPTNFISPYKNL
ncbi:hypothetical protein [Aurantibacter sp.]|uniref:hypothetical protein n=1 Tax=Aurantibacter sp. TaxID=2807103 RepID=UPI0035C7F203